jgi:hypothetical protein
MSSDGLRDLAARAVPSAHCASSTWRNGVGMSFAYILNSTRGDELTLGHTSLRDTTCGRG